MMATLLTSQGHGESMAMAWQQHGKSMAGTCQGHDMAIPLPRYGDARALVLLYCCHGIVVAC
jgi:hypothetical protein